MASNPNYCDITPEIEALAAQSLQNSSIDAGDYVRYDVKRGLRDLNGKGVLAGLTEISDIIAKKMVDGQEIPCDGKLYYRGIDVEKLVAGALKEGRFGFEETAYLLLLGRLPNAAELESFKNQLAYYRTLPGNFVRDVILKAPSQDIMNSLARSVLNLASYDERCDDIQRHAPVSPAHRPVPGTQRLRLPGLHLQEREQPLHTRPPAGAVHGGEHPLPAAA
mgnify:CR=1 FL=1